MANRIQKKKKDKDHRLDHSASFSGGRLFSLSEYVIHFKVKNIRNNSFFSEAAIMICLAQWAARPPCRFQQQALFPLF